MIYLFFGEDDYTLKKRIAKIKAEFLKQDPSGMGLVELGEEPTLEKLQVAVSTVSFFGSKRLVISEAFLGQKKLELEKLAVILQSISNEVDIIFVAPGKFKDKKVIALFGKHGKVEEFVSLRPWELGKWIKDEVESKGAKITPPAIAKLGAYTGPDLWRAHNEIEKLISYKHSLSTLRSEKGQNAEITEEDVEKLVSAKLENNIFGFIDALAAKNAKRALKLLGDMILAGEEEVSILGMIVFQARNLLVVKDLLSSGVSQQEIIKQTSLHPFVVQKSIAQSRNFTMEELKSIYKKLEQADIAIKTGQTEPKLALELLVAEICGISNYSR